MQYDFVCMNEECINNKRSFFKFNIESVHITQRHQVKPIHPLSYASFFPNQGTLNQQFKGQSAYVGLLQIQDQAIQAINKTVKQLFLQSNHIHQIQQGLQICQSLDMNSLFSQMSEGNYQLLSYLCEFERQKQEKNFKIFVVKKIQQMQEQTKERLEYLRTAILAECNKLKKSQNISKGTLQKSHQITNTYPQHSPLTVTPLSLQPQSQPQNPPPRQKKIYVKQQYIPPAPPSPKHPSYFRDHTIMQDSQSPVQISQDDQSQEQDQALVKKTSQPLLVQAKTKPIKKQVKRRKKNVVISEQVQVLGQRVAIVRTCTNAHKTLVYLHQNYPQLTIIHIFDSKMARQMPVKYILNNFPNIMKVTFNCYYELEPTVFDKVNDDVLNRIKIQFKWDLNTFFTEYFAFLHFPYKSLKRRQRNKKIGIEQVVNLLPSNNSLWIYDYQSNHKLNLLSTIKSNGVTVLNYCNNNKYILNIQLPNRFTNIEVLVLRHVYVTSESFLKFVQLNTKINTIFVSHCYFYSDFPVDQFLIHMRNLTQLAKLSISYHNSISHQSIFALSNLTHLNLDFCQFENEQIRDDSKYRNIVKMTKLKHLGLYNCKIYSPVLAFLSVHSINTITYLNLGRTEIDNNACQYLKKMVNLRYLNVDYTLIDGEAITDVFKCIARQNIYDSPFRSISIEKQLVLPAKKLTASHLKDIAKYLPKLAYLNIAFNENIHTYNFSEFKKLKTLAVDKDQYESLAEILSPQITRFKITQSHQYSVLWSKMQ